MENTLLNLIPSSYIPEVHLSQYDIGRELKFKLMDGNTEYSVPSGASVTVKATKPSGLGFVVNAEADGSIVTLSNTETMTNESGRFPAELSISNNETLLGTSNFIFNIEKSPHPEGTTDGDVETLIPELTLLVNEARSLVERAEESAESVTELEPRVTTAEGNIANINTELSVLDARMDTFASLPEGSTSGNAELLDIRVGADGTTYPTAGDAVRGQINDLKNGTEHFNYSATTVQKGAAGSVAATSDNTMSSIISSNNRIMIGAFKLKKSAVITPLSGAKFKLYKHFSNDSNAVFRDMTSPGWRTTPYIEGSNPKAYELCNYYIMAAYSNDKNITDINDLLSMIKIEYTNDNPLGLVESVGMIAGTGLPNGVGTTSSALRLVSYKQKYEEKTILYCSNPDIRTADYYGNDVYDSSSQSSLIYGCRNLTKNTEHVFMIQDFTNSVNTSIKMGDYTSFTDLYDHLGINVETLKDNNNIITGSQIFDASRIVSSVNTGETMLSQIFNDGILLNDNGAILYSHVPSIQIKNGFAYVVFQCDRSVAQESAGTTEIELAIIDLSDNSVTYKTIAKNGTYGGLTHNGRCSNPYTILKGNKLYIFYSGTVGGVQTLCCATYDVSENTFTSSACNLNVNGSAVAFNVTNYDRFIGGKYGIETLGNEIVICDPVEANNKYYITVCSGYSGQIKVAIMVSTDLAIWDVLDVIPYEYGADCEMAMAYFNSKLYLCARHPYKDATVKVFEYDITSKAIGEWMQLPAVGSRPTLFINNSQLVLAIPMTGRKTLMFVQIPASHISGGTLYASMFSWNNLAYNNIVQSGDQLFYAIQTFNTGVNTYGNYPQIWFGTSYLL